MRRSDKDVPPANAIISATTHGVRFRENPVLFPMVIAIGALFLWCSFLPTDDSLIFVLSFRAFAIFLILLPWIICARFFVVLDPLGISARGFFRTHRVEWVDLNKVIAIGYGHSFYGPLTYKLQGRHDAIVINLKFYSRECSATLFRQAKRLKIRVTYPKDI